VSVTSGRFGCDVFPPGGRPARNPAAGFRTARAEGALVESVGAKQPDVIADGASVRVNLSATTATQTTAAGHGEEITRERLACGAQLCSVASLPRTAAWAPAPVQTKACEAHHLPRLRERDQDGPRSLLRLSSAQDQLSFATHC
jgi:hypothetical protein